MATKKFTANGRTYQAGETIRVSDGQVLIARGYAMRLSKIQAQVTLEEYVLYAEALFSDKARDQKEKTPYIQDKLF